MAQMFLHRLSKLLLVCWMESHSVSLAHASESCSRTSQILNTDSTPAVCCSMSRCRSCIDKRRVLVEGNVIGWISDMPFQNTAENGERAICKSVKGYLALENRLAVWVVQMTDWQVRTELPCKKGLSRFLNESSIFSLAVWTILMCIQNPNLIQTVKAYLLILTVPSDSTSCQLTTLQDLTESSWYRSCTLLIAWSKTGITNCRSITKEQPMLHCFSYSLFQAPVLTACFKGSGKDPLPYLHFSSPELAGPSYSGSSFCTCNCSWSQCYIDTSCWKSISVQCYQPWPLMK